MILGKTYEVLLRKVSLEELGAKGRIRKPVVVGCEYDRPIRGKPYVIYIGKERIFKTSPVTDIKETYTALMIKTRRSIYRIKYLGSIEDGLADPSSPEGACAAG